MCCVVLQAIDAMLFYQTWAPNLPDIITHRAGLKKDPDSKKSSFYIGGRVSAACVCVRSHPSQAGWLSAMLTHGMHIMGVTPVV